MIKIKLLSIVVPAYLQEKTIARDLKYLTKTLSRLKILHEIIVVVDGLDDKTLENANKIKSKNIKVLSYPVNKGKGYAVKHGVLKARGNVIGFIDAGMDIDAEGIRMLLNHMDWYNADVIVGSKLHPVSQVTYPPIRRVLSWGYRIFTRLLFGFKIRDTQVGLKIFKRKVVKEVFPKLLVKKFAFDVEILAVAYSLGYTRIYEAPVRLTFGSSNITSKNLWKIILHMLWDTLAVYYRIKILNYYKKERRFL
jgi:glycosyltransferase involved in cell wall biosynthesis